MNIATKKIRHIKKILKIFSANTKAFFFPDFSISFEIIGINDELKEPSAKSLLKVLGNLKATKKTSA